MAASWAVARYKKIPFPALADVCAFGLLIGQIAGRWGNFMNVEAYGGPTDLPWRMGIEKAGEYLEVHPTFLYESLWNLIGFCLLCWLLHKGIRAFDGMYFLLYVAWYGLGRGLIEGLRTDSLYFFSTGLRTSQLLAFAQAALEAVQTNITLPDMALLAARVLLHGGEMTQYRVPAEGTYESGILNGVWSIRPDFEANQKLLRQFIYG